MKASIGELDVPWYANMIGMPDDPMNNKQTVKDIIAVEKEIASFAAQSATGDTEFKVWVESSSMLRSNSQPFTLTCNNETAVEEDGVLTFTGPGFIEVTPNSLQGGILHVEMTEDGVTCKTTYNINVVEKHTCSSADWIIVTPADVENSGFKAKKCDVCDDIFEVREFDLCSVHKFGEYVIEKDATDEECGYKSRVCAECGRIELDIISVADSKATFTFSDAKAKPGETVKVTLSLKTDVEVNSIAISNITYDSDVLEFIGFDDYSHIEDKCTLTPVFSVELGCIVIALTDAEIFDGDICTLEFKVKEDATDCMLTISAEPVAKLDGSKMEATLESGDLKVYTYILGDIDDDGDVDMDDAVYLFCYSMVPELFPLSYKGDVDFNADNSIDVKDAMLLFNYSMLPDIYPIY